MHTYQRKIHFYETDKMGIVHHSNYIRFFEEARVEYMDEIGIGYSYMESLGYTSPVISMQVDYHSPSRFDDILSIHVSLKEMGHVRFRFTYEIWNTKEQRLVARGESGHCFLGKGDKLISLKKENAQLFCALQSHVETPNTEKHQ